MRRTLVVRFSAGLIALGCAWIAFLQGQGNPPAALTVTKVTDDLSVIVGDGGNVAVYTTNEGVILVDDKYERDHDQIMNAVKGITNQPIKYILSTHYHEDHSGGNSKFASQAEIISTVNAHNGIVKHIQSNASPGMVAARVTFTQESDIFLGGKEVRARHFGRGHTNGDAVIYFPALRLVHTGDLVTTALPLVDYPGGGSLVEWPKTLDEVLKLDFDTVIPGHGPVMKKADIMTYRTNADNMRSKVQAYIRSGKSEADVKKFMTDEYKWMPTSLNMQWGFPGLMNELK
jgi:cyclase